MYVCIIKNKDYYSLKFNTVFIDRFTLLKELYKEPADYYIFDLNTSRDLFTDVLFITFYKFLYLQLHTKHPMVYPVKFINNTCYCCRLNKKKTWLLKKFLGHQMEQEDYYKDHNCIIYLDHKNRIDYIKSNINEMKKNGNEEDKYLFVCLSFRKQKLIPWGVYTSFKDALEHTITMIIKFHDFCIINNEPCFRNFYYIYRFKSDSNELCKSCIMDEDWCAILKMLKNAKDLKCYKNKLELCGKYLGSTIYNELINAIASKRS